MLFFIAHEGPVLDFILFYFLVAKSDLVGFVQICQRKNNDILLAAIMVLMISVKVFANMQLIFIEKMRNVLHIIGSMCGFVFQLTVFLLVECL